MAEKVSVIVSLKRDQVTQVEVFASPGDALETFLANEGVSSVKEYEDQRAKRILEGTEGDEEQQLFFGDIEVKQPGPSRRKNR